MKEGIIQVDPRHTTRRIRTAMQGNAIRALVELITNANDSYIIMEESGLAPVPLIEILYKKEGYSGVFAVRDRAQGMSFKVIEDNFTKYGAASEESQSGKRGYFGQGAKDALAGMQDGQICSFKDGQFTSCHLSIKNGETWYKISDSIPANTELRKKYGIAENGTYACFLMDPQKQGSVPRLNSVHEELAMNYQLRKIMSNHRRSIFLIEDESGSKRPLRYKMPIGKEMHNEKFSIDFSSYGVFPIHLSIWRSEDEQLTQTGDDREGGLLLIDEKDAVLGISLFRFDNEPLAARLFGEVKIGRFRELLDHEEAVLSEERDGLVLRHPFCQKLVNEIEKRLELTVDAERLRRQKQAQSQIDSEENSRFKKAFDFLNEIAEKETQTVINLGPKPDEQVTEPPNGFCLYPSSAEMTVGKRYAFELRIQRNKIRNGTLIKITCSNPKIHVLTQDLQITSKDNSTNLIRKHITVQGSEPNVSGILRASAGDLASEARVHVIPEKELLLDEGMAFQPESVTIRPNQPRKVYLLVYVKVIPGGSTIRISSDNENVHLSKESITVIEADAVRHVAKYDLDIWGEGTGQHAIITAEYESCIALLDARVKSKEEAEDKGRKGMFGDPEFDTDPEPQQRTHYSTQTGRVIIYVNFPSIQHYLGEDRRYAKTLPAQVLIADLVAERCFFEIAKKKVDNDAALLNPKGIEDRIQRDASELSKKYGRKVHEVLVDQKILREAKSLSSSKQSDSLLVR